MLLGLDVLFFYVAVRLTVGSEDAGGEACYAIVANSLPACLSLLDRIGEVHYLAAA